MMYLSTVIVFISYIVIYSKLDELSVRHVICLLFNNGGVRYLNVVKIDKNWVSLIKLSYEELYSCLIQAI